MSHEELEELLALHALGALGDPEAREVEAHLVTCAICPADLADLRDAAGWLGLAAPAVAPPAELRASILSRVKNLERGRRAVESLPARRRFAWRPLPAFGAFAAAATTAAFVMYLWGLSVRVEETERQLALESERATFLAAPETATVMLAGTDTAPKAKAKLAYDRRTGRALLFGYDLPAVPEGKAYQLWFIAGGKPLPGMTFSPDRSGRGTWQEEIPP
ncbi:MAG: anti-sigma factor domain-containing protein, partial [Candidatus Binatia bacterium]